MALVSPKSQADLNVSRSYGVAVISQRNKRWEYIKKEGNVGQAVADTLCREMGFTHALLSSVMSVGNSEHHYNYTYNLHYV